MSRFSVLIIGCLSLVLQAWGCTVQIPEAFYDQATDGGLSSTDSSDTTPPNGPPPGLPPDGGGIPECKGALDCIPVLQLAACQRPECDDGICVVGFQPEGDPCTPDEETNPINPCVVYACAEQRCAPTSAADGTSCPNPAAAGEGGPCVGPQAECQDGVCSRPLAEDGAECQPQPSTPNDCRERKGICEAGECTTPNLVDGTSCPLQPPNDCLVGECQDGQCTEDFQLLGTSCGGTTDCSKTCDGAGRCKPIGCDDGIDCTPETCEPPGDDEPDGPHHCVSGEPDDTLCPNFSECKITFCDPEEGCVTETTNEGETCGTLNMCILGTGTCVEGECDGEAAVEKECIPPIEACALGDCDELTGNCSYGPKWDVNASIGPPNCPQVLGSDPFCTALDKCRKCNGGEPNCFGAKCVPLHPYGVPCVSSLSDPTYSSNCEIASLEGSPFAGNEFDWKCIDGVCVLPCDTSEECPGPQPCDETSENCPGPPPDIVLEESAVCEKTEGAGKGLCVLPCPQFGGGADLKYCNDGNCETDKPLPPCAETGSCDLGEADAGATDGDASGP